MKKIFQCFPYAIAVAVVVIVSYKVCYADFLSAVSYSVGNNPRSVFAADLDSDGDNDLAVANYSNNNVSVLLNNGDGTFVAATNYGVGNRPSSVFAADLDSDGDNDLVVANYFSDNVSVLKNNGDGTFAAAVNYTAGDGAWSVDAIDLDGDFDLDLAVTNSNTTTVSIFLNNGDGTFAAAVNYGVQNVPSSVFAADLDSDGDNDLAVANYFSASISTLLNNGDGTFAAAVNYNIVNFPIALFAADLDSDGDNDLATANYDNANTSVLLNNGDGTFAAAVNYGVGSHPPSVFAADLDSDGDNDLAVANYSNNNVSVLLNNGDGTFVAAVNYSTGSGPWSVFAADLDSDGDNDLAVAEYNSGMVSIFISTVNNPVPTTVSISPDTKIVGDPGFVMTVNGTGFVANSVVRLNGSDRATTFVSDTQLTATILTSEMSSAGTLNITVFSPTPGGGTSNAQIFTVFGGGGGLPSEAYNQPTPPSGGFSILINSNAPETNSRHVTLTLRGGVDTARMALSNSSGLDGPGSTGQISYVPTYTWDLCNAQTKCPEGIYTVYVKFYTRWGRWSELISDNIIYKKQEQTEGVTQEPKPLESQICSPYLIKYLKYGAENDSGEVKKLQIFLRDFEGETALKISGIFDEPTFQAVIRFQEKYVEDILSPWGLTAGTGYVYKTTIGKINELWCELNH